MPAVFKLLVKLSKNAESRLYAFSSEASFISLRRESSNLYFGQDPQETGQYKARTENPALDKFHPLEEDDSRLKVIHPSPGSA